MRTREAQIRAIDAMIIKSLKRQEMLLKRELRALKKRSIKKAPAAQEGQP